MNWDQYSMRRGKMSLHDFLSGCETEQEALSRFKFRKIEDPPLEEIKNYFNPPAPSEKVSDVPVIENVTAETIVTKKTKATSGTADS